MKQSQGGSRNWMLPKYGRTSPNKHGGVGRQQQQQEMEDWQDENNLTLINQPNDAPTFYSRV